MTAFDELLYQLVEAKGSLRDFAAKVGQSHTVFSQIRAGLRPVPLEHAATWADALGLVEGSPLRTRFLDLAALTHLPAPARERFERLLLEVDDLKVKHQAMRRLMEESRSGMRPQPPPAVEPKKHQTPPPR